jgi:hypothetical protein
MSMAAAPREVDSYSKVECCAASNATGQARRQEEPIYLQMHEEDQ